MGSIFSPLSFLEKGKEKYIFFLEKELLREKRGFFFFFHHLTRISGPVFVFCFIFSDRSVSLSGYVNFLDLFFHFIFFDRSVGDMIGFEDLWSDLCIVVFSFLWLWFYV